MRDPRVKIEFEYYNSEKKEVVFEERHFLLDLNAIEAFEETTGINLMEKSSLDTQKMSIKELKALVWAGLLHEDSDLTIRQVGSMVHTGNMLELTSAITEAMSNSMPENKETGSAAGGKVSAPFDGTSSKQ